MSEISKICDRVGIIKNGKLLNVETIEEIQNKNLTFITIESESIEEIINELKINQVERNNKMIKFKSQINNDLLIKSLAKYKINKILIEEATLEDIFLHYYK